MDWKGRNGHQQCWLECLSHSREVEVPERIMVREEPKPCQEFRKLNAAELVRHIKGDSCLKCLAVVRYLQREYEITEGPWNRRN
jgi:hypothetical protein